ncbi:hypothetical protein ABZX92_29760 [Lentzea sp. NPDC006480]|uniref:hypothetical protein n=1 Tax=Lentzea sp. NPDC006480 TaxID=3157176 RepID=UPI0033B592E0
MNDVVIGVDAHKQPQADGCRWFGRKLAERIVGNTRGDHAKLVAQAGRGLGARSSLEDCRPVIRRSELDLLAARTCGGTPMSSSASS